jgi:putative transposase
MVGYLTLTRAELSQIYRKESDPKVKERLLLVLKVQGDYMIPARIAKELHRSRPWTSYWLDRFDDKDGIEGLREKPSRSGRPSKLSSGIMHQIRKELSDSSKQGWTTKQVEEMIIKKCGVKYHHYTHVYRLLHKWGFKLKVPRKRHINTASKEEEKEAFKKEIKRS